MKGITLKLKGGGERLWDHFCKGLHRAFLMLFIGLLPVLGYAQGSPTLNSVDKELNNVKDGLGGIANTTLNIVQLLAGIFALVALVTLVAKFQEGDHEAKKKLMMWLGALIVLFAAISIIKALFKINGGL